MMNDCISPKEREVQAVDHAAQRSLVVIGGMTSARVLPISSETGTTWYPVISQAGENQVQRDHRLAAIAAAIVQQNDIAAAQVAGRAWRQIRQDIVGDFLAGAPRIVAPVVGIDLLADCDVTEVLRRLPADAPGRQCRELRQSHTADA